VTKQALRISGSTTYDPWHRQAGTSCDELKDLGGWKSRVMVDRYAKFGTEHLTVAAARIVIENRGEQNLSPSHLLGSR
jgi:hypothetical protein